MQRYSFGRFRNRGTNILNQEHYIYKGLKDRIGRKPVLADFQAYHQDEYARYLEYVEVLDILLDPANELYVQLNNGARKGSIARVTKLPVTASSSSSSGMQLHYDCEMELTWDDGKTWSFKMRRNFDNANTDADQHALLVGYEGPTIMAFEKKPRPKLDAPELLDNYGRVIEVGHWVMNDQFRIGKVTRISAAGTLWIDMLSMKSGKYENKVANEQFGRSSTELLRVDLPEGFEVTAVLMDKDVTGLDIVPTFTYDARHD